MLEELRGSKEKEKIGEAEEVVESLKENVKNTLPYFELEFLPEDFTIAGYGVLDHLDDVEQAVAAVMLNSIFQCQSVNTYSQPGGFEFSPNVWQC